MSPVIMSAIVFIATVCKGIAEPPPDHPVAALIERILPGHAREFVFETIPAPSEKENVFEVAAKAGKIILRGDNTLSQCVALNYYLTHTAKVSVPLYAEVPIVQPETLPLPAETVRKTTRLKNRFFINYCTFGYSFPWWQWRNWERFIDWMALQGINMPLAQGGSEAVWQKVWQSYGLTDDEIRRDFFTGPAHLPWHRMGNLDRWDGPLPQSYIDGQLALTRTIVGRERSLGMKPVLPAFAGHVPPALKRVRPQVKLSQIGWCAGPAWNPNFIDPKDPLFREIQMKFLREQEKALGSDHLYGTDPFNEMSPPSWEPSYLASVSDAIYGGMAAVDPAAVWVQMGWTFQGGAWTQPRLESMIKAVPSGRMIILDYYCETMEIWRRHKSFYGAPFIWDYLGNFGGNSPLAGPVHKVHKILAATEADPAATSLSGIGSTLDGLNNQSMHEFLFARAWEGAACDPDAWYKTEAQAHAGGADPAAEDGFRIFWKEALGNRVLNSCSDVFTIMPRFMGGGRGCSAPLQVYDQAALGKAWKRMLEASPETRKHQGYQLDLADMSRIALANLGYHVREQLLDAWRKGDAAAYKRHSARFLEIGADLDALLGTRPEYLLGYWVDQARAWGKDTAEADYYEKNARTIVTTWMGRSHFLNDYADRTWNGMVKEFYLVRWKMYLDAMGAAVDAAQGTGKAPADTGAIVYPKIQDFEWQFAQTAGGKFKARAQGDTCEVSKRLFEKYQGEFSCAAK